MKIDVVYCTKLNSLLWLLIIMILLQNRAIGDKTNDTSVKNMCSKMQSMLSYGKYQTSQMSSNITYVKRDYPHNFLAYSPDNDIIVFVEPNYIVHVYNSKSMLLLANISTNEIVIAGSCVSFTTITTTTSPLTTALFFIYQEHKKLVYTLSVCQVNFDVIQLIFTKVYCIESLKINIVRDIKITGFTIKKDHQYVEGKAKSLMFISSDIGIIYFIFDSNSGLLHREPMFMNETLNEGNIVVSSSGSIFYANMHDHIIYELFVTKEFRIKYGKIVKSNAIKYPFGLIDTRQQIVRFDSPVLWPLVLLDNVGTKIIPVMMRQNRSLQTKPQHKFQLVTSTNYQSKNTSAVTVCNTTHFAITSSFFNRINEKTVRIFTFSMSPTALRVPSTFFTVQPSEFLEYDTASVTSLSSIVDDVPIESITTSAFYSLSTITIFTPNVLLNTDIIRISSSTTTIINDIILTKWSTYPSSFQPSSIKSDFETNQFLKTSLKTSDSTSILFLTEMNSITLQSRIIIGEDRDDRESSTMDTTTFRTLRTMIFDNDIQTSNNNYRTKPELIITDQSFTTKLNVEINSTDMNQMRDTGFSNIENDTIIYDYTSTSYTTQLIFPVTKNSTITDMDQRVNDSWLLIGENISNSTDDSSVENTLSISVLKETTEAEFQASHLLDDKTTTTQHLSEWKVSLNKILLTETDMMSISEQMTALSLTRASFNLFHSSTPSHASTISLHSNRHTQSPLTRLHECYSSITLLMHHTSSKSTCITCSVSERFIATISKLDHSHLETSQHPITPWLKHSLSTLYIPTTLQTSTSTTPSLLPMHYTSSSLHLATSTGTNDISLSTNDPITTTIKTTSQYSTNFPSSTLTTQILSSETQLEFQSSIQIPLTTSSSSNFISTTSTLANIVFTSTMEQTTLFYSSHANTLNTTE
ncbi:unnamed protein product, partial [Didymodactylos carnosus]